MCMKNPKFRIQNSKSTNVLSFSVTLAFVLMITAAPLHAVSSANIPLDSPVYLYLEKLAGFGLVSSDIKGLKPFSRAETARLVLEAERKLSTGETVAGELAQKLIRTIRESIPREISLLENSEVQSPLFDYNPVSSLRFRNVFLDGAPRDYNRTSWDPAHQSAFGLFGGDLRPLGNGGPVQGDRQRRDSAS